MNKDIKIGMIVGVGLAIAAAVIISVMPEHASNEKVMQDTIENDKTTLAFNEPEGSLSLDSENIRLEVKVEDDHEVYSEIKERIHIVSAGDTLSEIAMKYFGEKEAMPRIIKANPNIKDINKLRPGMRVVIPYPSGQD